MSKSLFKTCAVAEYCICRKTMYYMYLFEKTVRYHETAAIEGDAIMKRIL